MSLVIFLSMMDTKKSDHKKSSFICWPLSREVKFQPLFNGTTLAVNVLYLLRNPSSSCAYVVCGKSRSCRHNPPVTSSFPSYTRLPRSTSGSCPSPRRRAPTPRGYSRSTSRMHRGESPACTGAR
ncbi:hypothetical protein BC936DRAFT_141811 [Jimgerdemannia flammicorona]|uniref:Uncharacterized protein n=1 Tax=Jimgerdemannia flammicorona TaxID=994334 RepID=A0A433A1K8_9FUNG|nr:hypothetical protein BC936DRAFT_141811 [Jimgerdemannia flammicorona]